MPLKEEKPEDLLGADGEQQDGEQQDGEKENEG